MDLTLVPGQVVWAKLGGFPWWPASVKRVVGPNLFEVEYFGEFERNFFDGSRIRTFDRPPEKINRRNSKLLESHAQALRVIAGETTADEERLRFFSKKFETASQRPSVKRSLTHQDLSTNYSTLQPPPVCEGLGETEGGPVVVNESFVEETAAPEVARFIKGQIKTSEKSKGLPSTKRRKRISKPVRKEDLLQFTRHFSLPADAFKRRASLPHFDHLVLSGEDSQVPSEPKDGPMVLESSPSDPAGPTPPTNKEPSRTPKEFKQDLSEAKILENTLREILAGLNKERPQPVETQARLVGWLRDFRQGGAKVDQLFQTLIGQLLVEIVARCAALSAKPVFRELHATSLDILNALQGHLVSNFFRIDPFVGRGDLPIGGPTHILTHKKHFDSAENTQTRSPALPQSSNSTVAECEDPQNAVNYPDGPRQSCSEAKENEAVQGVSEEDAFRVSKKLARLLFEKVVNGKKSRAECEGLANAIEGRIRAISGTRAEYQRKWVYLFHRIAFNSEKFLGGFKEMSPAVGALPILDLVQALIKK